MSGVLKLFGYLSLIGGLVVAGVLLIDGISGMRPMANIGLVALAWVVGGAFWGALCVVLADIHDGIQTIAKNTAPTTARASAPTQATAGTQP